MSKYIASHKLTCEVSPNQNPSQIKICDAQIRVLYTTVIYYLQGSIYINMLVLENQSNNQASYKQIDKTFSWKPNRLKL